ncbi:MAG TPA: hypothetical protein VHA78_04580 [Candidatus Peribacteraceae bacterium]|nr:hypothetical protein [Candidatus Peribacteraceae bacterium]
MRTKPLLSLLSVSVSASLLGACSTAIPYDESGTPLPPPEAMSSAAAVAQHSVAPAPCPVLNTDAANTTVTYRSSQQGLSFVIPYNNQWGYDSMRLPAYATRPADDDNPYGSLEFGPPQSSAYTAEDNSCDLTHQYVLKFLRPRTAQAAVRSIEGADSAVTPTTQTRVISGLTVVQYTDAGACSYPTMEVIGQKYNYQFSTYCGENSSEEWSYLENIVKSVQLVK